MDARFVSAMATLGWTECEGHNSWTSAARYWAVFQSRCYAERTSRRAFPQQLRLCNLCHIIGIANRVAFGWAPWDAAAHLRREKLRVDSPRRLRCWPRHPSRALNATRYVGRPQQYLLRSVKQPLSPKSETNPRISARWGCFVHSAEVASRHWIPKRHHINFLALREMG